VAGGAETGVTREGLELAPGVSTRLGFEEWDCALWPEDGAEVGTCDCKWELQLEKGVNRWYLGLENGILRGVL